MNQVASRPNPVISPAQLRALQCWRELTDRYGYPPTNRELCKALGIRSTNAMAEQIERLISKGTLERDGKCRSRAIKLTSYGRSLTHEPKFIVIPEQKCLCGRSHFRLSPRCVVCARAAFRGEHR